MLIGRIRLSAGPLPENRVINFRYHIVSLTAVFLALIIGILMGTTVVSKATVDGLKANLARAETRSAAVHRTNDKLSGQLSTLTDTDSKVDGALTDTALANSVDGALEDVPVLVLAPNGVDKDLVDTTTKTLSASGAHVDGTLIVQDQMVLSPDDAEQLREELGLGAEVDMQVAVLRRLAIALAEAALPGVALQGVPTTTSTTTTTPAEPDTTVAVDGPDGAAPSTTVPPAPVEPEIIDQLRRDGMLGFRPLQGESKDDPVLEAPELAAGTGYRYVILASEDDDPVASRVLVPLVARLARFGPVAQVAAVGPNDPADPVSAPFLDRLLGTEGVKGHVSTVDNVGSYAGYVALAYALAMAGDGHFGSYGIGATATAVLPPYERPTR